MCHMIGILGILNKTFKASLVSKILKKDLDDLRSYFKEVGLNYDQIKDEKTGETDYLVKHTGVHGLAIKRHTTALSAS